MSTTLDRKRLQELTGREKTLFACRRPRARILWERAGEHMLDGVRGVAFALPWIVVSLGCRAECSPGAVPPLSGGEAAAAEDVESGEYPHLFARALWVRQ